MGSFESVLFPEFSQSKKIAKIDTGAYSGALHCTEIQIKKDKDTNLLSFKPFDTDVLVECSEFITRQVRSSNGQVEERYLIETDIEIQNQSYTTFIGLSDRSDMKYDVLIGRKFLRDNSMIVNVKIGEDLDSDVERNDE